MTIELKRSATPSKSRIADLGWLVTGVSFVCLAWSVWGEPGPGALGLFAIGFFGVIGGIALLGKGKLETSLDVASALFAAIGGPLLICCFFGWLLRRAGLSFPSERLVEFTGGGGLILLLISTSLKIARTARKPR